MAAREPSLPLLTCKAGMAFKLCLLCQITERECTIEHLEADKHHFTVAGLVTWFVTTGWEEIEWGLEVVRTQGDVAPGAPSAFCGGSYLRSRGAR